MRSASTPLPPPHTHPHRQRPDGLWQPLHLGSKVYTLTGWTLFAAGNLARFVSMRFASQTVLSGLGSLQFVLIPLVSHALLGIRPDPATGLGVAIVVLGAPAFQRTRGWGCGAASGWIGGVVDGHAS